MVAPHRFTVAGVKLGSVVANFASIASFALYLKDRASSVPAKSGLNDLDVVLRLALLTAICYGIL
jgi:hypothetical protein